MFKFFFNKTITIPTLRLSGIIGQTGVFRSGLTLQGIDKLIEKLFSNKKSPAVVLIINSPGGSPTQSSLIADSIISKAKNSLGWLPKIKLEKGLENAINYFKKWII